MNIEMSNLTPEMLKKGYLLFPKALFEEQMKLKTRRQAEGFFEAFIVVLQHVNYSDVQCCIKGHRFDCKRGESAMSITRWAQVLGWTRSRTRYFFEKMIERGVIKKMTNPYVTHICIPDYDLLTGKVRPQAAGKKAEADKSFDDFWQTYHEITEKPKLNIGHARREWKKLSAADKRLAMDNIEDYYDHLSNTKYCKQAGYYLADKSFKNEYDD